MSYNERLKKWAEDKYAGLSQEKRDLRISHEISMFELQAAGLTERDKTAFAEQWIKLREVEEKLSEFSLRANELAPSQKTEAEKLLREFDNYVNSLKKTFPLALDRLGRRINHVSVDIGAVIDGNKGKVRG